MKITKKLTRKQFAAAIVKQLENNGLSCVLVGGTCVSIYTNEKHKSRDLDFISPHSHEDIANALAEIGFSKNGRYFYHPNSDLYVEFPSGPIAIGNQIPVKPEKKILVNGTVIKLLSPTQSVMDRLAGWFHWKDRRGLIHAIWICERQPVNLSKIKAWAEKEGEQEKYQHFLEQLKALKLKKPRRRQI